MKKYQAYTKSNNRTVQTNEGVYQKKVNAFLFYRKKLWKQRRTNSSNKATVRLLFSN